MSHRPSNSHKLSHQYTSRPLIADINAKPHMYEKTYIEALVGSVTIIEVDNTLEGIILGLIISGRMSPKEYDATFNLPIAYLAKHTVLVDAPDVSTPEPSFTLSGVISEELGFANQKSGFKAINTVLAQFNAEEYKSTKFSQIPTQLRFKILMELSARRYQSPDGNFLIWVHPDLHSTNIDLIQSVADGYAKRGFGVIIFTRKGIL